MIYTLYTTIKETEKKQKQKHCQSDQHWNCFNTTIGKTSEIPGGAHMGFSERARTTLNRT